MPRNWKEFEEDEEPPMKRQIPFSKEGLLYRKERAVLFVKQNANKNGLKRLWKYAAYPRGSPFWIEVKNNLRSGATVSLVSVPLSISLAIAGGATPVQGIVTAFWAGLFAAFIGGSHFNIVGPTGALSGVLAAASLKFGLGALPFLAILAGGLALLVYLFHLDRYVMFIPSSVIHGFTLGVAFIIALNQLNSALGLTGLPLHEAFLENVWESLRHISKADPFSIGWFVINFSLLLFLVKRYNKIPWAIIFSIVGIIVGFLCDRKLLGPINLLRLHDKYPNLDFKLVSFPNITSNMVSTGIISPAIGVAFIGILETLISARIADVFTKTEHDQRREVLGFAVANIVCGTLGGIPATAALARTSLNFRSGATSRVSGIINAICVLLISFVLLRFFQYIPMSTIAALLVLVAVRMVEKEHLVHMFKYDKTMFWVCMLSAVVCVVMDTMAGILVGGIISLFLFVDKTSVGHTDVQLNKGTQLVLNLDARKIDEAVEAEPLLGFEFQGEEEMLEGGPGEDGDTVVYRITGSATYINSTAHLQRMNKLLKQSHVKNVIISLRYCFFMDLDGVDGLKEMITKLEEMKVNVLLAAVKNVKETLQKHHFFLKKVEQGKVFQSIMEALESLKPTEEEEKKQEKHEEENGRLSEGDSEFK